MSEIEHRNCPHCKEEINAAALKCRYCTNWVIERAADGTLKDIGAEPAPDSGLEGAAQPDQGFVGESEYQAASLSYQGDEISLSGAAVAAGSGEEVAPYPARQVAATYPADQATWPTLLLKVATFLLILTGLAGFALSTLMFGDIGIAALIGSAAALFSGLAFLAIGRMLP